MTRSSTWYQRSVIGVFFAALLAPGVAVAFSGQVRETISTLVNDPAGWSAQSYRLQKATPLWDGMVSGYSTVLYRAGTSSNEGFGVMGRDGWMFLGDVQNANFSQAIGRRQLSEAEIGNWSTQVAAQEQWLATRGIPMMFVVGPAKWGVYGDKLPAWSDDIRREQPFDQVLGAHPELPLVDLREPVAAAREQAETYSPLNSHWTNYGAYVGWTALAPQIEQLVGEPVAVPALDSVEHTFGHSEFEVSMGIRTPNPWTEPVLADELPTRTATGGDGTLIELSGLDQTSLLDLPRTTTNPDAGNDLTALVLRDSMGDALSPYLESSFGTLVQVRHNIDNPAETPNLQAMVDLLQPDVVIYEMAERHFNSGLVDAEQWVAANAYDAADTATEAGWQAADASVTGVALEGSVDLGEPTTLRWDPADGTQVVRISLLASGPGSLVLTGDDGSTRTLRVARDSNVLFAQLPAGTSSVTLTQEVGSAPVALTSAAVRAAR